MRLFFAFPLPGETRSRIWERLEPVASALPGIRWTRPENLHITAHFLGEVPATGLERLRVVLNGFVPGIPPFTAGYEGVSPFPPGRRPSVIVVPVTENRTLLGKLQGELGSVIGGSFPLDRRRFVPHITVGRVKNPTQYSIDVPAGVDIRGEFPVSSIVLFSSDLRPDGPVYTRILEIPLR